MDMGSHDDWLRALFVDDPQATAILRAVRALGLNDWAIGAGFARNPVWDALSGFRRPTPPSDIDVLYHDATDLAPAREAEHEARLRATLPGPVWSVTNQARMHIDNDDAPYGSTENALRHWLETPTCIALRLEADDSLTVLAPHGLGDLFAMVVRPTPNGRRKLDLYRRRIAAKNWPALWPRLRIEE